jgi:hypothetical protein
MLYQDIKYDEIRKKLRSRLSKLESSTEPPAGTAEIVTDDGLGYVAVAAGSAGDAVEIVVTEDSGVADAVTVSGDVITVALKGKKTGTRAEATITTTTADNSDWSGKTVTLTPNVPDAVPEIITEGVEWTVGGNESATATALAAAITASEVRSEVVFGVDSGPTHNEGFQVEINGKSYVVTFKTDGTGGGTADSTFDSAADPLFTATLNAGKTQAEAVAEIATLLDSISGVTATDVGTTAVELKSNSGVPYPAHEIQTPSYNSVSNRKATPSISTTSEVTGANYFSAAALGGVVTVKAEQGFLGRTAGADGNAAAVETNNTTATVAAFTGGKNPLETDVVASLINDSPEASQKIIVVEQPDMVPSASVKTNLAFLGTGYEPLNLDQNWLNFKYDPEVTWQRGTVFSLEQSKAVQNPTLYVVTSFERHWDAFYPTILSSSHSLNRYKHTGKIYFAQLNDSSKGLSREYPAYPAAGSAESCSIFTKSFFNAASLEAAEFTGGVVVNANIAYAANPICLRVEGGPYESGAANAYKGTYRQQAAITGTIGGNGTWTPTDGSVPWFRQDDGSMNLYLAVNALYGGGTERVWTMNDSYGRALTDSSCYPSGNSMEAAIQGGVYPHEIDLDDANLGWPTGWPHPFVISCP